MKNQRAHEGFIDLNIHQRFYQLAIFFLYLATLISIVSLIQWFGFPRTIQTMDLPPMVPNTVLGVFLSLLAINFRRKFSTRNHRASILFAALGIIFGVGTLLQYIFHFDLGIDTWFVTNEHFRVFQGDDVFVGRPSPQTSVALILTNLSVLLSLWQPKAERESQFRTQTFQWPAYIVILLTFVTLTGYFFKAEVLFVIPRFSQHNALSFQTAFSFLFSVSALLFFFIDRSVLNLLLYQTVASKVARYNLLVFFLAPPILGGLLRLLEKSGVYDPSAETAIFAVLLVIFLILQTWFVTGRLNREEILSRTLEENLKREVQTTKLLYQIAEEINKPGGFHEALDRTLEKVSHFLNWPVAHLYLIKSGYPPVPTDYWYFENLKVKEQVAEFIQATSKMNLNDLSLIGRGVRKRGPILIPNIALDKYYYRKKEALKSGLSSALVVPIIYKSEVIAIMEFYSSQETTLSSRVLLTLEKIGLQLGFLVERQRLAHVDKEMVKAREEVLRMVSHDLKSPLSIILNGCEMLEDTFEELEKTKQVQNSAEMLKLMESSGRRMSLLIRDLLEVTKIESGNLKYKMVEDSASEIAHESFSSYKSLMTSVGLQFELDVEPYLPAVICDRNRILQVLGNILDNALKFTEKNGEIIFKVFEKKDCIHFRICNTGEALDSNELDLIFQKFWQSGKTGQKGSGLGLAISRGIIEAHGGKIWAENMLSGEGCQLEFTLPVA